MTQLGPDEPETNAGLCAPPFFTEDCSTSKTAPTQSSSLSLDPEPTTPVFKDDPSPHEEEIEEGYVQCDTRNHPLQSHHPGGHATLPRKVSGFYPRSTVRPGLLDPMQ